MAATSKQMIMVSPDWLKATTAIFFLFQPFFYFKNQNKTLKLVCKIH